MFSFYFWHVIATQARVDKFLGKRNLPTRTSPNRSEPGSPLLALPGYQPRSPLSPRSAIYSDSPRSPRSPRSGPLFAFSPALPSTTSPVAGRLTPDEHADEGLSLEESKV